MKNSLCAFGLALTLGCSTAIVRPYVGEQQSWPVSAGSIVNVRYGLPIFTTLPPSPYEVIAEIRIDSMFKAQPDETDAGTLVSKAKELGADALVTVDGQSFFSTTYGSAGGESSAKTRSVTMQQVNRFKPETIDKAATIIAIRWTEGSPQGLPDRYNRPAAKPAAPAATTKPAPATPVAPPAPAAPKTNFAPRPAAPEAKAETPVVPIAPAAPATPVPAN